MSPVEDGARAELAAQFVVLNQQLAAGANAEGVLGRLLEAAVAAIPGCEWAGITQWPRRGGPRTMAHCGDMALVADDLQYLAQQGPCLDATDHRDVDPNAPEVPPRGVTVVDVPDVTTETRWPAFIEPLATRTPVRSMVALHLAEQEVPSALNLYSDQARAFDAPAMGDALWFAAVATSLLLHGRSSRQANTLAAAVASNRLIGTAVGIVMGARRVTQDQAFELLSTASQRLNRKLHDVAEDVVLTGDLPSPASASRRGRRPAPGGTGTRPGAGVGERPAPPAQADAGTPARSETVVDVRGPDGVEQLLGSVYGSFRMDATSPDATARLRSRSLGRLRLDKVAIDADFSAEFAPPRALVFLRPRRGQVRPHWRPDPFGPGDVHFGAQPHTGFALSYRHLATDIVVVPTDLLDDLSRFSNEPAGGIRFTSAAIAAAGDAHRFEHVLEHLWVTAEANPSPLVAGAAARLFLATMLELLPNSARREPTPSDGRDAHPAALRRALAFIDANADRDIGVADVAAAAGVSIRSVQLAFRRHLDTTPGQYLQRVRLHLAHADLAAGDAGTSVEDVAATWGFADTASFVDGLARTFGRGPDRPGSE